MPTHIAIAAYRCEIAGVPDDSLDIQVRYFDDPTVDIESFLSAEPTHTYLNDRNEVVAWLFVRVLAIEVFDNPKNGKEIAGFITGCNEFPKWTRI